jgi:hypothetical protein
LLLCTEGPEHNLDALAAVDKARFLLAKDDSTGNVQILERVKDALATPVERYGLIDAFDEQDGDDLKEESLGVEVAHKELSEFLGCESTE